mmetsp:Transcript_16961/g.25579  ORF Transcript_16961/g.25579 Transcript_16961/m.25579 type:complete len:124 (+) Transcript_16961:401-772(+)
MNPHGGLPPLAARCKRPAPSTINIIASVMKATKTGNMPVSVPEKRVVNRLLGALPSIDHLNSGSSRAPERTIRATAKSLPGINFPQSRKVYTLEERVAALKARVIGKMKRSEILEQFGVPILL